MAAVESYDQNLVLIVAPRQKERLPKTLLALLSRRDNNASAAATTLSS